MNKKVILIGAVVLVIAIGGYFIFDSIYGAGAGLMGLIFGKKLPDGIADLTTKEEALESDLEGLEDELGEVVDELDLDGEADHWND